MPDTSGTSATRATQMRHEYDTSMASERLQREEQFHSMNYLLQMPCFHAKMRLKSAPHKLKFFNDQSYIKTLYTRL